MRQIKFRGWDKVIKKRTFDLCIDSFGNIQRYKWDGSAYYPSFSHDYDDLDGMENANERFILDEFTGLNDINNKQIYENDVIKVEYGIGKVIFHHGSFMIEWLDDREANMELLASRNDGWIRNDLEVLGNIHENSEFLNQIIN